MFFLLLLIVWLILTVILEFRNVKVSNFRKYLINNIFQERNIDWIKDRDYYDSISYHEMIWKFWKPVDSFYDISKFNFNKYGPSN